MRIDPAGNVGRLAFAEFKEFVVTKVNPPLQAIALELWDLIDRDAPELVPRMRGGTEKYIAVPTWRMRRDVMVLSPSAKALTVSFVNGAKFDDPEGLLGGAGRSSRTMKFRTMTDLSVPSIRGFLRQAIEQDKLGYGTKPV